MKVWILGCHPTSDYCY